MADLSEPTKEPAGIILPLPADAQVGGHGSEPDAPDAGNLPGLTSPNQISRTAEEATASAGEPRSNTNAIPPVFRPPPLLPQTPPVDVPGAEKPVPPAVLPPLPIPPAPPAPKAVQTRSVVEPASSARSIPAAETTRVNTLRSPAVSRTPPVPTTTTPPLVARPPAAISPAAPSVRTVAAPGTFDSIPRVLSWSVLAISSLILIIQIWSYFST